MSVAEARIACGGPTLLFGGGGSGDLPGKKMTLNGVGAGGVGGGTPLPFWGGGGSGDLPQEKFEKIDSKWCVLGYF